MGLQPKYFNFIKNGTKRIELRLYDEKRQAIQLGDMISFSNDSGETVNARVIGLLRYQNFDQLFNDFDISVLADKSMTKPELRTALEEFYTKEKQSKYGVIGIRIELI